MSLVLTRRPGEKILLTIPGIKEPVVVTFRGYNGNSAVIDIDAPREIAIVREEIKDKKFEPKAPTSERKQKAPFLKAHKEPKSIKKTFSQAVASTAEIIRDEVKTLS